MYKVVMLMSNDYDGVSFAVVDMNDMVVAKCSKEHNARLICKLLEWVYS